MSFQKVVKLRNDLNGKFFCFKTVSFQKVVKLFAINTSVFIGFRTVSFQKVVKQSDVKRGWL